MKAALAQARRYGAQRRDLEDRGLEEDYQRVHKAWRVFWKQFNSDLVTYADYSKLIDAFYEGYLA
jgi:hypothetical protein